MVNNVHSQAQVHRDDLAVRDGQQAGAIAAAVIWQALQLATPFTDNVELTSADQRACTSYAYGFAAPAAG